MRQSALISSFVTLLALGGCEAPQVFIERVQAPATDGAPAMALLSEEESRFEPPLAPVVRFELTFSHFVSMNSAKEKIHLRQERNEMPISLHALGKQMTVTLEGDPLRTGNYVLDLQAGITSTGEDLTTLRRYLVNFTVRP